MSEIKFSCPDCGQHIARDESSGGIQIACPSCQAALVIPGNAPPAPQVPLSPPGCPACGNAGPAGAVICTNCGLNLSTGKGIESPVGGTAPSRPARRSGGSPMSSSKIWLVAVTAFFALLFMAGLVNESAAIGFHAIQAVFALGVLILVLIAAFKDGIGQGFLTLCVPFYAFYFVLARCDSSFVKTLFLIAFFTRLAGVLVKLPPGFGLK